MKFQDTQNLSRSWLSNPHRDKPIDKRLQKINAINLEDNFKIIQLNDSYVEIIPIDKNQTFGTQ
ncbi:hypothetical protein [Rummeliibacillus stabekisii]|uniref:hypothetical protein n=1 Tax=Rummeliibacillus stabekisii TaxID=241244 RepID=UPI003710BF66